MMNPYQRMVSEYARFAREGREYPLGVFPAPTRPVIAPDAPKVLLFSPHPDDEVIIGGLALRLMRESGYAAINVAVTQGSNPERQAGRWEELRHCCDWIGFGLEATVPGGLERIHPRTRREDPGHWGRAVERVTELLLKHRPKVVLFPHELDWNSTHVGTHQLVVDALSRAGGELGSCHTVETEFWGAMPVPNLMLELDATHVTHLITALTHHVGEVRRNPYHLSLPAWMVDNVRRGAELVGGQGGAAPGFTFATLYRVRRWEVDRWEPAWEGGRTLGCGEDPTTLFD
jgi:N-acetylglucosamine malate deacetylase 1